MYVAEDCRVHTSPLEAAMLPVSIAGFVAWQMFMAGVLNLFQT
jgi:hypothetical protein